MTSSTGSADHAREIIALELRRCALVAAGDIDAVAELLVEDYVHVHGNGVASDKADYLNWIRESPREQTRDNLKVRFYDGVAILNGDIVNRIQYKNQGLRVIHAYVTQVLVRRENRWKFVQWHIAPKSDI